MDGFRLVASLVSSLAWPLAVVACVVILRLDLSNLLHRLASLEFPGGKATFTSLGFVEETIAAAADETGTESSGPVAMGQLEEAEWGRLMAYAEVAPKEAVIAAWSKLERCLIDASDHYDPTASHSWPELNRTLRQWPQWPLLQPAVRELKHLRDVTARAGKAPSSENAARYVNSARESSVALKKISAG